MAKAGGMNLSGVNWAKVGGYASAGLDIFQGLATWASAGDIGRAKKKLLESRANYNRKQISDAFKHNYAIQMSQYAQQLSDLSLQKLQAQSEILQNVASNKGAIDIQGSSFKDLAFSTLKGEFNSELNKLIDNNMNANISLSNKAIMQEQGVNLEEYTGKVKVDAETDEMKIKGIKQVLSGMTGGISNYFTYKNEDKSQSNTKKSISNFNELLKPMQDTEAVKKIKKQISGGN